MAVTQQEPEKSNSTLVANNGTNGMSTRSRRWTSIPFLSLTAHDPPATKARIPEIDASWWSILTFNWITPIMYLGYARPLQENDLFELQDDRKSAYIGSLIMKSWDKRTAEAEAYNVKLANGEIKAPLLKRIWWDSKGEKERLWREKTGRKEASLIFAMNDSIKWWFWSSGIIKVIGDTAQVTSPLLVKEIINFSTVSYAAHINNQPMPPIGKGIGLAFGLLALQIVSSLCMHHFFYRSASTGVLIRGGLIHAIYVKSLNLTARARGELTNGLIMNHISTDISRIDFCSGFFHMAWSAPIQLAICLVLLILQLGPSALAGFALFALGTPLQGYVTKHMFSLRAKSMKWTDKRAKLLQELLGGMKIIKFFAWEIPFRARIEGFRKVEMQYIRSLLLVRSGNNAVATSLPVLASVLSFATYSLSGHTLEANTIFTSLTLFNLLRMPLMMLPLSLGAIADAVNATHRLGPMFRGETVSTKMKEDMIDGEEGDKAVIVENASFTWDAPPPNTSNTKVKKGSPAPVKTTEAPATPADPFKLPPLSLSVKKGSLVAIVGPVGCGKTSLLQGLIGEMRKTEGKVSFCGSVAYCPQSAWIQNATVRENICFGREFDEEKYWKAIKDACLGMDLEMWEYGDMTEVGEKGISLSGGQKQRLNIARAIYCDTDIQIFDDPLSALDAHIGKSVFNNVLMRSTKTRILVTHALHFLPFVDVIYTIENGEIKERGGYAELMANNGVFAKFVTEFGTSSESSSEETKTVEEGSEEKKEEDNEEAKKPQTNKGIMQTEERNTGAIAFEVYKTYLKAARGAVLLPMLILALALMQGTMVMSSYWLVWWQQKSFGRTQGFYMGVYAALGLGQALAAFLMGASFALLTYFASQRLHKSATDRIMHAPMWFFDTTPLGRIMNRFSKDIDTMDNLLADSFRMFFGTMSTIVGAIILISIVLPWFLIAVAAIMGVYLYAATFYRASARELKRLDAILRSSLYSHFSESLSGLTTIRAYDESSRFIAENETRIDVENQAYWLTVTNQRWLGIRLDFLGALLTFVVAILCVGTRDSISPAKTGLVLSYILSVQQAFGWLVRQSAEVENNMNSVERITYYATSIPQERTYTLPLASSPWPSLGKLELKNVVLKYRPELPPVLKGISMVVEPGEKIGIVGRTGAGKSSIMTAIYRLVELEEGSIWIDDVDVANVGLKELRKGVAIIPQDAVLFSGTLRTNLDPFDEHDDATLWDALKRSYLVDAKPRITDSESESDIKADDSELKVPDAKAPERFSLDMVIEDEGVNLSIGQRSLVSLARAIVKNSRLIILDEATASVDYETDRNIQATISTEFKNQTVLCIAHRLRTIINYDRICVLDKGLVAEFDTPEVLYEQTEGIFRGMCDRSSITREDIRDARKGRLQ